MPKSRRDKQVQLTKTKKKGMPHKHALVGKIQECIDKFQNIFVISAKNLQNDLLKEIRDEWIHSRFFFGKNTVMAHALGRDRETEYKRDLYKVSARLHGHAGLLFTNSTEEEVLKWFAGYKQEIFAKAVDIATQTIVLDAGELKDFQHTMEPQLRELGLPTELQSGVIKLLKDFEVCRESQVLNSTQAQILKLFKYKTYVFQMTVQCMWSKEKFKGFTSGEISQPQTKVKSQTKKKKSDVDEDDVESLDDDSTSEDDFDEMT